MLNWKMEGGKKGAKARLVAKGYQNPNLKTGLVEISGCFGIRSSHLQMIPPSAPQKLGLRSLGTKDGLS